MAEFKLTPADMQQEIASYRRQAAAKDAVARDLAWLRQLQRAATALPGGYVKKIVWDKEGGYPEHAWGYVQWTVRPFVQGYGCDGTTDGNVHLVALTLCAMLDIDYRRCYREAYAETEDAWIEALRGDLALVAETLLPIEPSLDAITLMLSDLSQINNHSLVTVLAEALLARGWPVEAYWKQVDDAKAHMRLARRAGTTT